jgi:hypothetical protein
VISACASKIYLYQTHLLQIRDHRDLHLGDLDRRDVELHLLMDLNCDRDLTHLVHLLLLDVVQNLDVLLRRHQLGVVHQDAQQNLDVEHLDVEHLDALHPLAAVADAELRHLLRKDYFLDEADAELRHQLRKDYFLDVAQLVHPVLVELLVLVRPAHLESLHVQQLLMQRKLVQPHVMPSVPQDRRQVLLRVRQQVLDSLQALRQQLSSPQLSLPASSLQQVLHQERAQLTYVLPAALLWKMLIGRIRPSLVT